MKVKDGIKFKGFIKTLSTGEFVAELKEFYVDSEWYKLKSAMQVTVGNDAFSENLTTDELDYIKAKVDVASADTKISADDKAIVDSILKKIPVLLANSAEDEVTTSTSSDTTTSDTSSDTTGA